MRALQRVAATLGDLRDSVVFIGGATVPLLVTDPGAGEERATDDVDVIVEVASLVDYHRLIGELRARGFTNDVSEGAPICRLLHGDQPLDVMPADGNILGFKNSWFRSACETSWECDLGPTTRIRVAGAPELLATKVEAFNDRGGGDFVVSSDIEDFVSVVDGRIELIDELSSTRQEIVEYLHASVGDWLDRDDFLYALPGHLSGDAASQARVATVLTRLRWIAGR